MRVCIVEVGKSVESNPSESRNSHVEVMIETIEGVKPVCHSPINPCAAEILIQRHWERLRELREVRGLSKLLAILVVAFDLQMPEQFVLNDGPSDATAKLFPVERRLGCGRAGLVQTEIGT